MAEDVIATIAVDWLRITRAHGQRCSSPRRPPQNYNESLTRKDTMSETLWQRVGNFRKGLLLPGMTSNDLRALGRN